MQAAGWTVHDILLYQTPLHTIGKSLRFIFEIHNHIFSMNPFSYFIVNPVTIVSTLLLENRYTALNTTTVYFIACREKLLDHKLISKAEST